MMKGVNGSDFYAEPKWFRTVLQMKVQIGC